MVQDPAKKTSRISKSSYKYTNKDTEKIHVFFNYNYFAIFFYIGAYGDLCAWFFLHSYQKVLGQLHI